MEAKQNQIRGIIAEPGERVRAEKASGVDQPQRGLYESCGVNAGPGKRVLYHPNIPTITRITLKLFGIFMFFVLVLCVLW